MADPPARGEGDESTCRSEGATARNRDSLVRLFGSKDEEL
jgi:hypothetical protein